MYVPKLTHEQRRQRREQIAAAIAAGKSVSDVMCEFGVSSSMICQACRDKGVKRERKKYQFRTPRANKWANVDWSLRDADIAVLFGVTAERVRQMRRKLGAPNAKHHRMSGLGIAFRAWAVSHKDDLANLSLREIRELSGSKCHSETIVHVLKEIGVEPLKRESLAKLITKENLPSFTDIRADTGCWEWKFNRNKVTGYGMVGGSGYAHRFAYELFNGPTPVGMNVLHRCDNPCCVNPDHLYAGTDADNVRDRVERRRGHNEKLGAAQVAEIRQKFRSGVSVADLAAEYKRSGNSIYKICLGRSYKFAEPAAVA